MSDRHALADERGREVTRLRGLLARLDDALQQRLADLERKPHLPYWAGVAAAYADARKLLRDPGWLAAAAGNDETTRPTPREG